VVAGLIDFHDPGGDAASSSSSGTHHEVPILTSVPSQVKVLQLFHVKQFGRIALEGPIRAGAVFHVKQFGSLVQRAGFGFLRCFT
jgi:hypothetical protein